MTATREGRPRATADRIAAVEAEVHSQALLPIAQLRLLWAQHHGGRMPSGVEYAGKTYRSLSDVARTITGTRWSGPRFFGLEHKGVPGKSAP